jgi:4-hydroxy-tetrahydrodipicolinate synthase
MVAHFRAVADGSDLPVILYNVPTRTGVDLLPETAAELSGHERIVAIKEAVGRVERIDALRRCCQPGFAVLSGDDHTFLEAMRHGADGVISVAANAVPRAFSLICDTALRGDWQLAGQLEAGLRQLFDQLMTEPNPIPVKWALHELSLCGPLLRLPLTELSVPLREPLRLCLEHVTALSLQSSSE